MNITPRELEVLKLLCLQDKEISKRLIISVRTVKCHIHNILNKLVCETRQKALIKALKFKIIDIEEVEIER